MAEKKKSAEKKPEEKVECNEELEALKAELAEKNDLLLRTAAEFDNYKKRTERERISTAEYAKINIVKTLLPVFDGAVSAEKFSSDSAEYRKGVEMIVKQLSDAVKNLGLSEFGEVGDEFDPNRHNAVMHIEDENFSENTIAEVFQKGYLLGDTVIRPAMVKVAN